MQIPIVKNVLESNDNKAEELREQFNSHNILVLNLISSPGAGKTSLLEKTLADLSNEFRFAVIEGDLQTDNDARRIAATGTKAVQINTEGGCHLNAAMIAKAIENFDLNQIDILFIENVGNMVCPVEFDCGEHAKVALLSTTEGDDKPEKYPTLFSASKAMVLNKIDLLPYVPFSLDKAIRHAMALNAELQIFPLSCTSQEGLTAWYDWLRSAKLDILSKSR